jgi:hypothetical protein
LYIGRKKSIPMQDTEGRRRGDEATSTQETDMEPDFDDCETPEERERADFTRESMQFLVRLINEQYPRREENPEDDPLADEG